MIDGDRDGDGPLYPARLDDVNPPSPRGDGRLGSDLPDVDYQTLANTIETEIIPRLLRAHRGEHRPLDHTRIRTEANRKEIADFAELVINRESDVISAFVAALLAGGTTSDIIFLDLLAPTADYLGDMWWTDACTFTDVTLALFKLQGLLREYGHQARHADVEVSEDALLLAAVPGSQHVFGFLMVEEFFRRAGWNVSSIPAATADDIVDAVRSGWFAVVGLSMSSDKYAASLPALIAKVRRVSRNRAIAVIVGGSYFNENPGEVAVVGADATAGNARDAVVQAKRLLTTVPRN